MATAQDSDVGSELAQGMAAVQLAPEQNRTRLILIGKTGAGKSATANTICGQAVFKSQAGVNSETKDCGFAIIERDGKEILGEGWMQKSTRTCLSFTPDNTDFAGMAAVQLAPEQNRTRLILIGKTGAGKSATANTICGQAVFKSQAGVNSETKDCGFAITERDGKEILVMDTPGLCDTDGEDREIATRITESLFVVAPGPHAVILVLRCDARFTEQETKVFNMLKDVFGEDLTSFLVTIFVGKDNLDQDNVNFEDQLQKSTNLKKVLEQSDFRYVLFNNRGTSEEKDQMVDMLLEKVEQLVAKNDGKFFRHKIASQLDKTMSAMVDEEVRQRTGESWTAPDVTQISTTNVETRRPKPRVPIPHEMTLSLESPTLDSGAKEDGPEVSHAEKEAIYRKKEMNTLRRQGTVKSRLMNFEEPQQCSETKTQVPHVFVKPAPKQLTPEQYEQALDKITDQLQKELEESQTSPFLYKMQVKPHMNITEKGRLVEDAIRKKVINSPEKLNTAQKKEMDKAVDTVDTKVKKGMNKAGLKSMDRCYLM